MCIDDVKHYLDCTMKYAYVYIVQHDNSLKEKSCKCKFFVKQIDENTVEATVDSGYGHHIVLVFTSKDGQMFVSVKYIAYFGDLLNIVNLRRHGFYDDTDMLSCANYSGNSIDFFKIYAKKYANPLSEISGCMADVVQNAVNVGMKKLIKKGLSNNALQKKQQHEQTVADNASIYKLLTMNQYTTIQAAISSVIDERHNDLILVKSYSNFDNALYFNQYDGTSYSKIEVTDQIVSNLDNIDKNLIAVANGITLDYQLQLDASTQELSVDGDIRCKVECESSRVQHTAFKNVKYVKYATIVYDIRQEVLDICPFMSYEIQKVSIEQVKELVTAFIKSVDRVNKLISYTKNVAID